MGTESTATRGSCAGGSEGKGPTDGTHQSARAGEQTGGRSDERDMQDSEGRCARAEKIGADKSDPLGSERERGERLRMQESADRRGGLAQGRARGWVEMGLLG